VYEHLGKVIDQVVAEKPKDAHGLVEVLSRMVKEQAMAPAKAAANEMETEAVADHVKKLKQLDKAPVDEEGGAIPVCAIPDFVEEAEMLSWAGVGFGEIESYKVMCSLRNLAAKEKDAGLIKLRFWGKVFGQDADYYVAEAQRDGGGEEGDEADPDAEPAGTGANQYAYYVTNDLAADWRKLPDIKPKEIIAARAIKRLLTGNAGSKVVTHPYFAGKEEVLLRAIIARITADTVICMKGYLVKEEDGEAIAQNEEFACPSDAALAKKDAWTHMQPHILMNGRTTHKELPEEPPEEEAELKEFLKMKEEQAADPQKEVLRSLEGDGLGWTIKQAGDPTLVTDAANPAVSRSNCCTYLRSLSWPGAVCVIRGGHFANLYVGNGLKAGEPSFFIPAPPDVQDEPEDPGEVEEPQGEVEAEAPPEE